PFLKHLYLAVFPVIMKKFTNLKMVYLTTSFNTNRIIFHHATDKPTISKESSFAFVGMNPGLISIYFLEIMTCGTSKYSALNIKSGTMTGTVPAFFFLIPVDKTFSMRTNGV